MPAHIRRHSALVARVAHCVGTALYVETGLDLSFKTVVGGALLHDIGKHRALETGEDHAKLGRQICKEHLLAEISEVVAQHVILKAFNPFAAPSEKEVVYYADKRVNHNTVVSLQVRRSYILERYGNDNGTIRERIKRNFDLCKQVEKKLFRLLTFGPESIPQWVEDEEIGWDSLRRKGIFKPWGTKNRNHEA